MPLKCVKLSLFYISSTNFDKMSAGKMPVTGDPMPERIKMTGAIFDQMSECTRDLMLDVRTITDTIFFMSVH
jgi:hypothetical protein